MATFAMNSCYIALGTASNSLTDYSAYISAVTLQVDVAELDSTDFADSGWTVPIAGRKSGSLQLTFNQDVASGAIDQVMWSTFGIGTTIYFEIRATNANVGTSNPKWTGAALLNSWSPVQGSVGDLAQTSVTLPLSGAVTRATA